MPTVKLDIEAGGGAVKELDAAARALEGLGSEGKAAAAALDKLAAAADNPKAIAKAAAQAEIALNELAATGKATGATLDAAMDRARAGVDTANKRAAVLRDTMGDMRTKGDLAAKGFEAVAGQAGSLDGMLGALNDTGGKTSQAIAKTGFEAIAVASAFKLGYDAGKQFDAGMKEMGVDLSRLGEGWSGVEAIASGFAKSLADSGVIWGSWAQGAREAGKSTSAYGDLMGPLLTKINPVIDALHAKQKAAGAVALELKALGLVVQDTTTNFEAQGAKLVEFIAAEDKAQAAAEGLAGKTSGVDNAMTKAGKATLGYRDSVLASGQAIDTLDPATQKVIARAEEWAGKIKEVVKAHELLQHVNLDGVVQAYEKLMQNQARIGASATDTGEAIAGLAKQYGISTDELLKLIGKGEAYDIVLRRLSQQSGATTTELERAVKPTDDLSTAISKITAAADAYTEARKRNQTVVDTTTRSMENEAAAASKHAGTITETRDATDKLILVNDEYIRSQERSTVAIGAAVTKQGENQTAIVSVAGAISSENITLAENIRLWNEKNKGLVKGSEDRLKAQEAVNKGLEREQQTTYAAAAEMQRYQNNLDSLRGSTDPFIQSLGKLDGAQESLAKAWANGEQAAASYSVITWELAKATDAQVAALDRLVKKFDEVSDRQNILVDYAANILASVQTGLTSVDIAITQLNDTIQQLTELRMKNMGTVFEEQITKMLAAYEQLRMQLQMGQAGSTPRMRT